MKPYYKCMLAVHLENGTVAVRRIDPPRRPPGHALLRLIVAGICNTDLELQRGYYGFRGTPGHEFVAEVVEAGDRSLVGKRVVGEINLACGHCDWCCKGLGRHCPSRSVLGIVSHPGAFSEYFTLPESNLHVVPDDLPSERAVFAKPLAAACEILDQVTIPWGEQIAVLGDGKLGLLVAMHSKGNKGQAYICESTLFQQMKPEFQVYNLPVLWIKAPPGQVLPEHDGCRLANQVLLTP